jgi:SH3 domain protein
LKRLLRTTLCCCLLPLATALHAEDRIRYVRDWIKIPLHETQSDDSAVVHSGVTTGTALTIVQEDPSTGYTRVRTSKGVEGWIAVRYLSAEPTARMQLEKVNVEIEELRKTNARLEQELGNIPADQRLAAQELTQLRSDSARLQAELQMLQEAPSKATLLARENIELKKSNAELHTQADTANTALTELKHAQNYTLFREGALAVFAGAILTVLLPRLKPKKRSEWV